MQYLIANFIFTGFRIDMNINYNYRLGTISQNQNKKQVKNPTFTSINDDIMKSVPLHNVRKVVDDVYRGASPTWNLESFKYLKDAGVERIIDIAGYDSVANGCREYGIEYNNYLIDMEEILNLNIFYKYKPIFQSKEDVIEESHNLYGMLCGHKGDKLEKDVQRALKRWDKGKRSGFEKLINIIQKLQQRNVYVCCENGSNRTDLLLMFNSILNPQQADTQKDLNHLFNDKFKLYAEKLYHNLTDTDKIKLGWTKVFDEQFLPKLKELKIR